MYQFYSATKRACQLLAILAFFICCNNNAFAQATVSVPVGIGKPCGGSATNDSLKYFNYNSTTNTLTHRSNCKPNLASPFFSSSLATITFNPFDGYLYFSQIKLNTGVYSTYTFRWLPTICPAAPLPALPVYQTFTNQFVAGVEFDPATGLGYQINFVDSTGYPPINADASTSVGQYTSGANVNGFPAMAYYDYAGGTLNLKYVRATDVNGINWGTPITIDATGNVGQYVSMAIVNGNPAISYYDATNTDLKYVRASDVNGAAWGAPVVVEASAGIVGQFTSLAVVNGNPAISYYDATNLDVRYVRATNSTGTTWGAPVSFLNVNSVGQYTALSVVNGNPAISYYDATNGDLDYLRSSDANGVAWPAATIVEATGNVGQYTSMSVINGNPAIAFYDVTNGDLRYIRSADASGTSWAAAGILVAGSGAALNVGQYPSLTTISGNPAISYYDVTNLDLRYIRSSDINGTTWGAGSIAEATGSVGQYSSLIIANGYPAICYFDLSNKWAKYVRADDAQGNIWYRNTGISNMELQSVNFATGILGPSVPINFGPRYIYKQNGDVVMTPGGQMLAAFDNKYFTLNWKDYGSAIPLVATYIDTLKFGVNNNLVGLSYSGGKLVGSIQSTPAGTCFYKQIDILTGAQTAITYSIGGTLFGSADMTNIPSGIGAAKKLVSAVENPVGSKIYDVVYEIFIKNYGGTPVSNIQGYDTLNNINGAANVLSGSITSFVAPAGILQNTLFDGRTAGNFSLLAPSQTLSNNPGQNTITLQITTRIANINPGIVYNNQARVTGTGLLGDALADLSTNGSNPDLNLNDKPDDPGESQPTPLLISIVAQTPPCTTLTNVLYNQDFGTGVGLTAAIPAPVVAAGVTGATAASLYTSSVTQPIPVETYTVTNDPQTADNSHWLSTSDHTGNVNGDMLVVNADANNTIFYRGHFNYPLCAQQQYSLSFYSEFVGNASYQTLCNAFGGFQYPKIKMRVVDGASGGIITEVSTATISNTTWQQYGLKFVLPVTYSDIYIELVNDAPGGCGNDIAFDDIQFGTCDAMPVVNVGAVSAGCVGGSTTFNSTLTDPTTLPGSKDYQWQVSSDNITWVNVAAATGSSYTINPILAADTGKFYRVLVAATGNISSPYCRYTSAGAKLTGKVSSLAATSATKNKSKICPGISVTLGITGGSLGTNAAWKWYSGSCGGTFVGTGSTISVSPIVSTTYYVLAQGDCNTTSCQSVTIFVSCDLDKDKDGIPDYVESNIPAALTDAFNTGYPGYKDNNGDFVNDDFQADGDSNGDGVLNYLDPTFPGRVDTNGDGVDDRFDFDKDGIINMLDLDSDNDGIPDVVEAGGVDADGDGKIDNYTDTDGDGISQNVDANNTGANNSGLGLGSKDLDGDGLANEFDLDSDNDGIPDVVEAGGSYNASTNNGLLNGFVDANGDGISDNVVGASALLKTGSDINNDGRADSYPNKNLDQDKFANPYDLDSDGDGIVDVLEAGFADADFNGKVDGTYGATTGWSTVVDAMPTFSIRNTDGRGNPDYLDIDADDDGIPDNIEGQTTASYKFPSGVDADNDGIDDAYDVSVGFGGSGIFLSDKDVDGIPDYRDLDTDSDGAPDINEGNDFNLNGLGDDNVTLTLLDTDGDGLDNRFDSLNSVTNLKGTSYMMGTGGSVSGDATPGARCTVQKANPAQADRDWRYTSYVLGVKLLTLAAVSNNETSSLTWSITSTLPVDRFELQRSIDNINYIKIETQEKAVPLNTLSTYYTSDAISALPNEHIFYRMKVINKNGQVAYSNVAMVKKTFIKPAIVSIHPNPASDYVSINFSSDKEYEATIRLSGNLGKVILIQKQHVLKGSNSLLLTSLSRFSSATYILQIIMTDQVVTQKLIIQNK